jgi:microcystin-dependent protein
MSSSGINAINSGPLNIRTYNNSSNNNTFILGNYDIPVSSNLILITSTNGQLAPSNNIYVSSIAISSLVASTIEIKYAKISTLIAVNATISTTYLSTVSSIGENITFITPVTFDKLVTAPLVHFSTISSIDGEVTFTAPLIAPITHFSTVSSIGDGITFTAPLVLTESGAESTIMPANISIWGKPAGDPIYESFPNSITYTINSTINTVNFQLIGAGGHSTFSNPLILTEQYPGYGAYIAGTLKVKQGDSLVFTIGGLSDQSSGGTSLIYVSTTGSGHVSTLVCIAGAGGGNGYSPDYLSTSSGGGHGGGGSGTINIGGLTDYIAKGTLGYDGFSTINGILQSVVDGGQGGQITSGGLGGTGNPSSPYPGTDGDIGANHSGTFLNGGIVSGGAGGQSNAAKGGWGGSGYTGGGGGGALSSISISTSAGGGGGATYIATSTLSGFLENVVCLGGQFLQNNNAAPIGGNYGLPNNPGYGIIEAYTPNCTLYTNGDIDCRVLRYQQLDPPINAIGGVAALWSLYPAIDIVNMNNNPINECGGLEISENGMDVTGPTIISGDTFVYSSMNSMSPSTFRIELGSSANLLVYKSTVSGSDATVVQNTGGGRLVLGTDSPAIYMNGLSQGNNNVGIGTTTPDEKLDVEGSIKVGGPTTGNIRITNTSNGQSYIQFASTSVNQGILNFARYGTTDATMTINTFTDRVGINTNNPLYDLDIVGTTRISSLLISLISTLHPQITISAGNVSTVGNASVTGNFTVNNTIYSDKISSNIISSGIISLGLLNVDTISSGIIRSGQISSNTISSAIGLISSLYVNTISSGLVRSNLISSNTISSGIITVGNYLSTNTINMTNGQISALDVVNTNRLSSNTISSGIGLFGNYLSTNTIYMSSGIGQIIGVSTINGLVWPPQDDALWSGSLTGNIYNDNTGNVGIGTNSPDEKLDVEGAARFGILDEGYLRIAFSNGTTFIQPTSTISSGMGGILRFTTYGRDDTTMIINTFNDRVGIKTTSPQYELDVNGTTRTSSLIVSSITTLQPQITITAANVSTVGNSIITGDLIVNGTISHPDVSPVGAITMYAGSSDPAGWLLCDGRSLATTGTYSELFNVIAYTYGGSASNFLIPDMRQRFPVGVGGGYNLNTKGGVSSITLTTAQLPSHSHTITDPGHSHTATHDLYWNNTAPGSESANCYETDQIGNPNGFTITISSSKTGITGTNNTGSGNPIDNRPPFIGINYIIKY